MGSTLSGLMDAFARSVSYGLQHGVPLQVFVKGMTSISFAPSGITDDADIRTATSLVDYLFRRIALNYLSFDDRLELGLASFGDMPAEQISLVDHIDIPKVTLQPLEIPRPIVQETIAVDFTPRTTVENPKSSASQAPMCYSCGNQTQRSGSCYVCTTCGSTTGCS